MKKYQKYPNLFAELGIPQEQINKKLQDIFDTMFFHPVERIYFETGENMGYMLDGTPVGIPALHPVAIIATNATGSLAAAGVITITAYTFSAYLCLPDSTKSFNLY